MSKTKTTATQKPKVTSTFADLYKIDVNDYTEQKGWTYLLVLVVGLGLDKETLSRRNV